jgi:hypothetical protein
MLLRSDSDQLAPNDLRHPPGRGGRSPGHNPAHRATLRDEAWMTVWHLGSN